MLETNNRIGVFGTSRTGKSWLMKWIVRQYIKLDKRRYYIIIDENALNLREYEKQNFFIQELDRSMVGKSFKWKSFIQYHEKIVFLVNDLLPGEICDFLDRIGLALYLLTDSFLGVDEAHMFLPPGKHEPENILRYERGGAKVGCDFLVSTHRTTDVSPTIINLLNVVISFRVNEINTIERLSLFFDKFTAGSQEGNLVDPELNIKQKREAEKIISVQNPFMILKNLPNRWFLYADLEEGRQEISTSNILK